MTLSDSRKKQIKEEELFRLKVRRGAGRKRILKWLLFSTFVGVCSFAFGTYLVEKNSKSIDRWLTKKEQKLERKLTKGIRAKLGKKSTSFFDDAKRVLQEKKFSQAARQYEQDTGGSFPGSDILDADDAELLELEVEEQLDRVRTMLEDIRTERDVNRYPR